MKNRPNTSLGQRFVISPSDVSDAHYSAIVKQFLAFVLILSCCIMKGVINLELSAEAHRVKTTQLNLNVQNVVPYKRECYIFR